LSPVGIPEYKTSFVEGAGHCAQAVPDFIIFWQCCHPPSRSFQPVTGKNCPGEKWHRIFIRAA
jgi:hypothetical protein